MDKDGLLKSIADTGYNVGFGAKKHFATYDIVEKVPGWIGFISIACGIFGLVFASLSSKLPCASLAVLGIIGLYIYLYDGKNEDYDRAGKELTRIYNELRDLCRSVQGGADVAASYTKLKQLENEYYAASITKQILFSDWYAHYKFFVQQQIGWIDEHKRFTLRDKVPLSMVLWAVVVSLATAVALYRFSFAC